MRTEARQPTRCRQVLACLLAILVAAAVEARQPGVDDVSARGLLTNQPDLRMAGHGALRMLGLRIYDARLFVTNAGLPPMLVGRPYALDLRYARAFQGRDIARRSREEMERIGRGSPADRERWQAQLTELLPDVRAGDYLGGLYQPDVGTTLLFNGRPIGRVAGDDFAAAFFAIWLDAGTSAPALRRALLADAGSGS
jgi:hypothetical protein